MQRLQIPVYVEHLGIYLLNMNIKFVDCQFCILNFVKKNLLCQERQPLKMPGPIYTVFSVSLPKGSRITKSSHNLSFTALKSIR